MLKQKIIVAIVKEYDQGKNKWNTVGYRFLDLETKETETFHIKDKKFLSFMIKNRNNIVNGTWDSGKMTSTPKIKFINGIESRYPVIDAKTGQLVGTNPLVIAAEFKDGYMVVGPYGEVYEWTKKQAVAYARLNGIANGKYSSSGRVDFISSITGSYPMIERKVVTPEMKAKKKSKEQLKTKPVKEEVKSEVVKPVQEAKGVQEKSISFNLFDRTRKLAGFNKTVEELFNVHKANSYTDMFVVLKSLHKFAVLEDTKGLKLIDSGKDDMYMANRIDYEVEERNLIITFNTELTDGKEPVNSMVVLKPKGKNVKLTEKELAEKMYTYWETLIAYLKDVAINSGEEPVLNTEEEVHAVDVTQSILEDTSGYTQDELESNEYVSESKFSDDFYYQLEPTFGGHNSVEILKYMIEERNYSIDAVYKLIDEGKEINKYVPTLLGLITRNKDADNDMYDTKLEQLCSKAIEPEVLTIEKELIDKGISFDEVWDANVIAPKREHDTRKWAFPLSLLEERIANYLATTGEELYGCSIGRDGAVSYNGQSLEVPGYRISGVNPSYITVTEVQGGKTRKVKSK